MIQDLDLDPGEWNWKSDSSAKTKLIPSSITLIALVTKSVFSGNPLDPSGLPTKLGNLKLTE